MKSVFKLLLGLIGGLVVLLVVAGIALPMIYDTEDLKRVLIEKVETRTGRELSINGPLDFSVFPWIAVEVNDVQLGHAPGLGEGTFATVGQARIGVALMPLLRKQIAVDEVTLDGLDLKLEVNEYGLRNWEDLALVAQTSGQEPSTEASTFSSRRIAGLKIQNARLEYQDHQSDVHYLLSGLAVQTGALGDGTPYPLELTALLEDLAAKTGLEVDLSATVLSDLPGQRHTLDDVRLDLVSTGPDKQQTEVTLTAPLIEADMNIQSLELPEFKLEVGDLKASGNLSMSNILGDPAFTGNLTTNEFSPAGLMTDLGLDAPVTTDPDVLRKSQLTAAFAGTTDSVQLTGMEMQLDQSRLNGNFNMRNFASPLMEFTLNIDQIDVDRYLAPAEEESATEDVAIPRQELQGQEVQGKLTVANLRMAGLQFDDASVGVSLKQGKLRLSPLTAGFYGGTYNGDIALDGSGQVPVVSLDETIDAVTFQKLVGDLVSTESLSGMAKGHVQVSGSGTNSTELLGSLNGTIGLSLSDGALEGINIWHEIRKGMAKYKNLEAPPAEPNRTVFSRMEFDAQVDNGIANTRQLVAELPFLTLTGDGNVNIGQSTVDLRLVAAVRNMPELASDPLTAELNGRQLPFRVSGSMDDPTLMVDWEALLKSEAAGMLLNKLLGDKKKDPDSESNTEEGSTDGEQNAEGEESSEDSSDDALENVAKGALFQLLQGKDKDEQEPEENDPPE